jgi:hypothetical protein
MLTRRALASFFRISASSLRRPMKLVDSAGRFPGRWDLAMGGEYYEGRLRICAVRYPVGGSTDFGALFRA